MPGTKRRRPDVTTNMSLNSEYASHKLLVANRGEIAVRIIRTAQRLGIATVAIYTSSDALSPHVAIADEAAHLQNHAADPQQLASESKLYLSSAIIVSICRQYRVTMVHPGYGFLSENEEFALSVEAAGMIWLGPQPDVIRIMGLKHEARRLAAHAGLRLVPGSHGLVNTLDEAISMANTIGFPVILKATAGGGGMGLLVCQNSTDLSKCFISAQERATVSIMMIVDTLVEAECTFPSHCFVMGEFLSNGTTLQHAISKSRLVFVKLESTLCYISA